jgi:MYXO-CTERM domain-containing protein
MRDLAGRLLVAGGLFALGAVGAAGCADPTGSATDDGSLKGELAVYVADTLGAGSETRYFLRDDAGQERKLVFDPEPTDLDPGTRLEVWGLPDGDGLRVTSYRALPAADEVVRSPLINGTTYASRTFAFVFVDIGGGVTGTMPPAVDGIMTTNADSIRNYYLDDSFRTQDISTYVTQMALSYPMADCSNTTTSAMASALRSMVGTYQHYLWYFGTANNACQWSGLASLGTPQNPSRDTWYNHSTNCVVLVQEPGHNFGMQHSSSLACPGASYADDPNTCTDSEYGDVFDPMGGGCRHMNGWQKSYQGWLQGCNVVKVTDSGTFNLVPIEPSCNGVQLLQIKSPKSRTFNRPAGGGGNAGVETFTHYYVELRAPDDFDGTLASGSRALTPMVLIHVANDLRTRTQSGLHTFLLDMTPSTAGRTAFNDAGLAAGQSFTDPAGGLTITTQSLSATGATINVTYASGSGSGAAPTCIDSTTFAPPGPGIESCSGAGGSTGTGGSTGSAGTVGTGSAGTNGAGGRGGTTGSAGTVGTGSAGTNGTGGRGGTTGSAGTVGTGTAGTVGTGTAGTVGTGAAGTVGTGSAGSIGTGTAGVSGTGDAGSTGTGTAGTLGTGTGGTITIGTGSAGATGTGTGNTVGTGVGGAGTGAAGSAGGPGLVSGGCSCETAGARAPSAGLGWMLGAVGLVALRGRRRRGGRRW